MAYLFIMYLFGVIDVFKEIAWDYVYFIDIEHSFTTHLKWGKTKKKVTLALKVSLIISSPAQSSPASSSMILVRDIVEDTRQVCLALLRYLSTILALWCSLASFQAANSHGGSILRRGSILS